MLSEDSSVKGSPEDKQAPVPCVKGSAKISRRVTLAKDPLLKTYHQHPSYVMQLHYHLCVHAARHIANNETSTQIFSAVSLC